VVRAVAVGPLRGVPVGLGSAAGVGVEVGEGGGAMLRWGKARVVVGEVHAHRLGDAADVGEADGLPGAGQLLREDWK